MAGSKISLSELHAFEGRAPKKRRGVKFVCPKCGSDRMYELALCVVIHRVRRWAKEGTPEEYEAPEVDWESDMPYGSLRGLNEAVAPTFECAECDVQFEQPKRAEGSEGIAPSIFPFTR
jgi:predicted RNA-binding Zn-ribbon protein involved in translation (DUF1610 family)